MQIKHERFDEGLQGELEPLLTEHWEEIALNRESVPLRPKWESYYALERSNHMRVVTARDGDRLVGYVVYFLYPNLHYDLTVAEGDIFWLHPDYRRGALGLKLMKKAEEVVKAAGAQMIVNKTKLHKDLGKLFERMGFNPIERVYSKVVV